MRLLSCALWVFKDMQLRMSLLARPSTAALRASAQDDIALHQMGIETGVDLAKVRKASRFIAGVLGHSLTSKAFQALEASDSRALSHQSS